MNDAPHRLAVRIYYEDTDFSGVVYHASYLRFLERGRTEMLRDAGVEQAGLADEEGRPSAFAVRHMTLDFVRPARMDDLVEVETEVEQCGGASLKIGQVIKRGEATLLTAQVKVAFVCGGRARRIPPGLAARLLPKRAT